MKKKNQAITKDMALREVVERYPESAEVMMKHGLHCIGCYVAAWESIEQGAAVHGIDADKLVKDINNCIKKKK